MFEPPANIPLASVSRFDPIGGMQNHAAELTRALDSLGVRQIVVTARIPGSPRRQRLGTRSEVLRLGWPIPRLRQLYSVPAAPEVIRVGARSSIVHVHLGEDLAVVPLGVFAAALHSLPLVLTIHCSLRHTFTGAGVRGLVLRSIGASLEHVGTRAASGVIVLTERLARLLQGTPPRRGLHVIPSGVNPMVFDGPFDHPLPAVARPTVLFVGRLAPQKGVLHLVRAVPLLLPHARVVLVGDGPQRRAVEDEVARLGLHDRVSITGFVEHERVPAYLAHADVLVLPSVYEELGSVLLEGMQSGVPIVAARTGGIPGVIRDGETGVLCEPENPGSLAAAINRVLLDPELRGRITAGATLAARTYDWRVLARRVLSVYHDVLGTSEIREVPDRVT